MSKELEEKIAYQILNTSIADEKVKQIMSLIQDYSNKRVIEADRKTLETVAALLNGDYNQVEVVKNYVHNKLLLKQEQKK